MRLLETSLLVAFDIDRLQNAVQEGDFVWHNNLQTDADERKQIWESGIRVLTLWQTHDSLIVNENCRDTRIEAELILNITDITDHSCELMAML